MEGYQVLNIGELAKQRQADVKQPFPHQSEAFTAMSMTLPVPIRDYRGTLLVLPTGAGKTFTSINWICRNVLSANIKVLWLAQSSFLLDQAMYSFTEEIHHTLQRHNINMRVVSSSSKHANAGSVQLTDDVLICTIQTAIGAYASEQLDIKGNVVKTPFRHFLDSCIDSSLFVVVDEAHHTPAYGCRTMLISMRKSIPHLYILGLTATPMHMDKRISGWLRNIYDRWICYEADKSLLQGNKILAVPKYIQKETGFEMEVDDTLYDRLVYKHKDLPEHIVESLAKNQSRNNMIVSDYVNNRSEYGKTIIFADRWYQCEYIMEKLNEQGVSVAAVYSVVTRQGESYQDGTGRRNDAMNQQIMEDFKKTDKYEVIVNVRMLTEGIDVPTVKTVMVTRQTTSNILLTQMIGRALRGEKIGGGKDYANIVFFSDTWRRVLPWANVEQGMDANRPIKQGRNPMALISIQLIKLATADIEYKGFEDAPFLTFIPVGFYGCEFTVAVEDTGVEEMVSFEESIVVYEFNRDNYERLISYLLTQNLVTYAVENVSESQILGKAEELVNAYFDPTMDDFDGMLVDNVGKLLRHVAQNGQAPQFLDFHDRDLYDMDKLAEELRHMSNDDTETYLMNMFNNQGQKWNLLYRRYEYFLKAFHSALRRIWIKGHVQEPEGPEKKVVIEPQILTRDMKAQVLMRDNYTCLCCGKSMRKGVSLEVDHIIPVAMGGRSAVSNLQTLCKQCNALKSVNAIDFRVNVSPMSKPKTGIKSYQLIGSDSETNAIARIVNEFFHCRALCTLNYHTRRSGQFYSNWEIVLYEGNNPEWLAAYKHELLEYIRHQLGKSHVQSLIIRN